MSISSLVSALLNFYFLLIVIRCFLTFFQNIDMQSQPFKFIATIVDPYLNIFRGIIPPIGGMLDISPIIAILLLQFAGSFLIRALFSLGL